MSKLTKSSSKNQLFAFALYGLISDGNIESGEVNKLLKHFNYEKDMMDDFIKNGFINHKGNEIELTPEIISEIKNQTVKFSDYGFPQMGNSQKHFMSRLEKGKISLLIELQNDKYFVDTILPLIKGKQISIDFDGFIITQN